MPLEAARETAALLSTGVIELATGHAPHVEATEDFERALGGFLPHDGAVRSIATRMDKQAVRHTLRQLAAVLELKGEDAVRVRALQRAARSELLATGRSSALDELREQ